MERGETGNASQTEPGDWIIVKREHPRTNKEGTPPGLWDSTFDVVIKKVVSRKQPNNPSVILQLNGSIGGNTRVKKVASDMDHFPI